MNIFNNLSTKFAVYAEVLGELYGLLPKNRIYFGQVQG